MEPPGVTEHVETSGRGQQMLNVRSYDARTGNRLIDDLKPVGACDSHEKSHCDDSFPYFP